MNLPRRTINTVDFKSKNTWFSLAAVLLIILGFMFYQNRDSRISLNQDNLMIHGIYRARISYTEISQLSLVQDLPRIETRTNGYAFLNYDKGYFRLAGIGKAELFVNVSKPPFIHLKTKDGSVFYLNYSDAQKTRDLFDKIQKKKAGNN